MVCYRVGLPREYGRFHNLSLCDGLLPYLKDREHKSGHSALFRDVHQKIVELPLVHFDPGLPVAGALGALQRGGNGLQSMVTRDCDRPELRDFECYGDISPVIEHPLVSCFTMLVMLTVLRA